MTAASAADLASGKGHTDENFPVASFMLKPAHRGPIMAFYRFARTADDVSDNPDAPSTEKLAHLEAMRATLNGESNADAPSLSLRQSLMQHSFGPQNGFDLLEAFRRDCTKTRYADWAELLDYCRYSAAPVGRFVLDVHGEDRALWPANDALCAALQVINHLQDCGKDRRALDRVYLPMDVLTAAGLDVDALLLPVAPAPLRRVISGLAARARDELLMRSRPFASRIKDARLAFEVAFIQRLAEDLCERLIRNDPLSERVHHSKLEMGALALRAGVDRLTNRR
ncbi:squalene synthase HpnC [soil metagenome]